VKKSYFEIHLLQTHVRLNIQRFSHNAKEVTCLHSIVCEIRTSKSENHAFKHLAFLRKTKGFLYRSK